MSENDDWELACSDEEKYEVKLHGRKWQPPVERIVELFEKLSGSDEGLLPISWTCPGRRPPTPEAKEEDAGQDEEEEGDKPQEKDTYLDFEDENAKLCLRPAGDVGPRGSAKKKTTSLDAILSNMARHRRMDMMDEDPDP
ncbi:PAXIP1-associated glutamate-rich protein 1-like [Cimex lectularius]|uniref:PAXIP1-associated glutamate-rich protein 1 n=1 Tax=Cimex lectularius TaxID=79782 RepID=A0A8I6S3R8_CIMLE|nr:PAXIP1-associated glutamate-rich protein 1-like [Cimex lectularius]